MGKHLLSIIALSIVSVGIIYLLGFDNPFVSRIVGSSPNAKPPGDLVDPVRGLWGRARVSELTNLEVDNNQLSDSTQIVRDERGVPHIFASTSSDAIFALGFSVAQDRLFQLDFIPRVAAGRLSEIMGPTTLNTDRYLRSIGLVWGARKNLDRIIGEDGEELKALEDYARGVNAYQSSLKKHQLPLEFQLLNYTPDIFTPLHSLLVAQFMAYDLSFRSEHTSYGPLQKSMNQSDFEKLFPLYSSVYVPVVPNHLDMNLPIFGPPPIDSLQVKNPIPSADPENGRDLESIADSTSVSQGPSHRARNIEKPRLPIAEGFKDGFGSNNWVVGPSLTNSGMPLLANDMHLRLTLPSIFYEAHMVTPEANVRGVALPGTPFIVQGFNDYLAWGFTNSGADQIDHYELELNPARNNYMLDDVWTPFELEIDTLRVRGENSKLDTLRISHLGPMIFHDSLTVAIQWTAHKNNRILLAAMHANKARNMSEFDEAMKFWDGPMQNIVYADVEGNYAIRTTGHLPIRNTGHGIGVLDGSDSKNKWIGRIPFDQLPYSLNPDQGYLASANQQLSDDSYPYYTGFDWYQSLRSIRINDLLKAKSKHGVEDFKDYQSDEYNVERDMYVSLIDTLSGLSRKAEIVKDVIVKWSGEAKENETGPLAMYTFLNELRDLVWDEFEDLRKPRDPRLYILLRDEANSPWLDIRSTSLRTETASDILRMALGNTSITLEREFGSHSSDWTWGEHHSLTIEHVTGSDLLSPFWRGPYSVGGMNNTLSPAGGLNATHSASWRIIVDFSDSIPKAIGINPGGQSGDPLSRHYDTDLQRYVYHQYNKLGKPKSPAEIVASSTAFIR